MKTFKEFMNEEADSAKIRASRKAAKTHFAAHGVALRNGKNKGSHTQYMAAFGRTVDTKGDKIREAAKSSPVKTTVHEKQVPVYDRGQSWKETRLYVHVHHENDDK